MLKIMNTKTLLKKTWFRYLAFKIRLPLDSRLLNWLYCDKSVTSVYQ